MFNLSRTINNAHYISTRTHLDSLPADLFCLSFIFAWRWDLAVTIILPLYMYVIRITDLTRGGISERAIHHKYCMYSAVLVHTVTLRPLLRYYCYPISTCPFYYQPCPTQKREAQFARWTVHSPIHLKFYHVNTQKCPSLLVVQRALCI